MTKQGTSATAGHILLPRRALQNLTPHLMKMSHAAAMARANPAPAPATVLAGPATATALTRRRHSSSASGAWCNRRTVNTRSQQTPLSTQSQPMQQRLLVTQRAHRQARALTKVRWQAAARPCNGVLPYGLSIASYPAQFHHANHGNEVLRILVLLGCRHRAWHERCLHGRRCCGGSSAHQPAERRSSTG